MTGSRRRFEGSVLWLVVVVCLIAASHASGRPMNGEVVTIREPDGTFVEVRVWGDEFYARGETLDGYSVVRDRVTGMLAYARLSDDGRTLLSTGVPAGESPPAGLERHLRIDAEAARRQARLSREAFERRAVEGPYAPLYSATRGPTTGEVHGITLIVDFDDDVGTVPSSWIDDYCNLPGYIGYGNHGSVRDYFYDVSDGRLDDCGVGVPDGEVPLVAYAGPSFPNPTSQGTSIAFELPSPGGAVSLRIYSASGRLFRTLIDETLPPARHVARWDGRDESGAAVSSGVYLYRLTSPGFERQGKTVVLR